CDRSLVRFSSLFPYTTLFRSFWTKALLRTLAFLGICLPLVIGAALGQRDHKHLWRDVEPERVALLEMFVISLPQRRTDHQGQTKDRKSTRLNSSHVSISYAVF